MTLEILGLLAYFGIKHFFADFVFQLPYMVQEKGTYGAWGGIHHAGFHAVLTLFGLCFITPLALWLALFDFVAHYHIDWAKQQLNRGLTAKDNMFWVWLGLDQALHYLTYIGIIYLATN